MKRRILVIEDDLEVLEILRSLLDRRGYEVLTATDGRGGVARLDREPVDLVITDMLMPDVDGIETLGMIHKVNPRLPVIAMSGGTRSSRSITCASRGSWARRAACSNRSRPSSCTPVSNGCSHRIPEVAAEVESREARATPPTLSHVIHYSNTFMREPFPISSGGRLSLEPHARRRPPSLRRAGRRGNRRPAPTPAATPPWRASLLVAPATTPFPALSIYLRVWLK